MPHAAWAFKPAFLLTRIDRARSVSSPCCQKYKPLIEKLPARMRYMMRRMAEAWEFGAGKDYKL